MIFIVKPTCLTEGLKKTAKYTSIAEYQTMYAQMNSTRWLLRKLHVRNNFKHSSIVDEQHRMGTVSWGSAERNKTELYEYRSLKYNYKLRSIINLS